VDPLAALDACGGAARWTRLAALGVGRGRLLSAVNLGDVVRPARGVFCRPDLVRTPVVLALCASGQLTCLAGARAHGLETLAGAQCHVRTSANPKPARSRAGILIHPWGRSGDGDTADLFAVLHDCALCLPGPEAVAVIDSALRSRRLEVADLEAVARSGPRPRTVRRVLALADPGSQSVLESVARVGLVQDGVERVASQVFVDRVGWVDLMVQGWLVIELDGWAFHREKFQDDRRRDAELTRRGFVVLRFTYGDLTLRRHWFLEVVRETLERGRPPFGDLQAGGPRTL
jgi:very-short-patch-repair endonuclease